MVKYYSESQILELLNNYFSLFQKQWGDERNLYCEDTQKRIFQYEKDILATFGLPLNSDCYLFLFDRASLCSNHHHNLAWLQRQLSIKADSYFQNSYASMRGKKRTDADPFIVLPELGVPVNSYTLFLYNKMLYNSAIQKTVWHEFAVLKKMNKITDIYLLCFDVNYHKNLIFHKLIEEGLHLLPAYLRWYHSTKQF